MLSQKICMKCKERQQFARAHSKQLFFLSDWRKNIVYCPYGERATTTIAIWNSELPRAIVSGQSPFGCGFRIEHMMLEEAHA